MDAKRLNNQLKFCRKLDNVSLNWTQMDLLWPSVSKKLHQQSPTPAQPLSSEAVFPFFFFLPSLHSLKMLLWGTRLVVQHRVSKMCLMLFLGMYFVTQMVHHCIPFIRAAFCQHAMHALKKKKKPQTAIFTVHFNCTRFSSKTFRDIRKQQQIKHYFHMGRAERTSKRFSADCSFYYH